MVLEGAVFTAGQCALLDDLDDDALPGMREGVEQMVRDERWHVGFGVRCLTEAKDPEVLLSDVLTAPPRRRPWGDAVPTVTRHSRWTCADDGCRSPAWPTLRRRPRARARVIDGLDGVWTCLAPQPLVNFRH